MHVSLERHLLNHDLHMPMTKQRHQSHYTVLQVTNMMNLLNNHQLKSSLLVKKHTKLKKNCQSEATSYSNSLYSLKTLHRYA